MRRFDLAAVVLLLSAPLVAHAQERRITVEEAVDLALRSDPHLAAQRDRARGGDDGKHSVRGHMLPAVRLSDEFQYFDSPFTISFGPQSFTARDQSTNNFTAVATQPLLGLFYLAQDYQSQNDSAEAAAAGAQSTEAAVRQNVQTEYLRLFEARALEALATDSEHELGEQVTVAEAKVKAGVLTTADLLRVRVALANARQQGIVARTQELMARANLLGAMGLGTDDASVDFVEPTTLLDQKPDAAWTVQQALAQRTDLAQTRLSVSAAEHTQRARFYSLFPTIDAEGGYIRIDGQAFAPKDQWFIGLRAQWAVWEWGASWYAQQASAAQASAMSHELEGQRTQVSIEVTTRRAQVQAAASAVDLARETITSAEEAYRVTEAALRSGAATTTDLLDSQAALTQARLNLARARYQEAVAYVALRRAVGA